MEQQQNTVKNLILPMDLAMAIASYLQRQPYGDVAAMMGALASLKPLEPAALAPKPEGDAS